MASKELLARITAYEAVQAAVAAVELPTRESWEVVEAETRRLGGIITSLRDLASNPPTVPDGWKIAQATRVWPNKKTGFLLVRQDIPEPVIFTGEDDEYTIDLPDGGTRVLSSNDLGFLRWAPSPEEVEILVR